MKTAGIIVEYNPFHNGHLYHLKRTRTLSGADFVIAVMSGDFVQRGEPALLDKYTRTQMALLCGADLVLELPAYFAIGSAGDFAAGAVSLLDKLGVVDTLCFGSECGSVEPLLQAACVLAEESPAFSAALQENLKQGLSFPHARTEALKQYMAAGNVSQQSALEEISNRLSSPNNILGLEYCLALQKRHSSIHPITISRKGAGYHDLTLTDACLNAGISLSSASAIRQALKNSPKEIWEMLSPSIPAALAPLWEQILSDRSFLFANDLTRELRYRLLLENSNGFSHYADVTRELSDKIKNAGMNFSDWSSLCDTLKSKELTYSRISRALCHILLSVTKEALAYARQNDYVPYARILGFRQSAVPLLTSIKKNSSIPLLSKLADAKNILPEAALGMLKKDILASHLRESALSFKTGQLPVNEYTRQIRILK